MTDVIVRGGKFGHTHAERRCLVKMEVKTGVTLPQGKEHLGLPKTREARKDPRRVTVGSSPAYTLILNFRSFILSQLMVTIEK
jgi:hypothetical protein